MASYFSVLLKPFSWSSSTTSTNNSQPVQHQDNLTYLFRQINRYLHELDEDALRTLCSILTKYKVDKEHAIMKKIESTIIKVQSSAHPTLKTSRNTLQKIFISPLTNKMSTPHVEDDTSFIDDGSLSLDEFKKLLEQKGDKLTKLTVQREEFNEEYFTFMVDECPHLQELQLGADGFNRKEKGLNDKSLEPIAKLQELTALKIKFTYEEYFSISQITHLFEQPNLQKNLQQLELPEKLQPNSGYLAAIEKFQNLKSLILPRYDEATLVALFNAPSLIKTVESLKYSGGITDSIGMALGKLQNLKSLHIHCSKWNVQSPSSLAQGLASLIQLEKLIFRSIPVRDDIAASLENCMNLKKVSIDDFDIGDPALTAMLKNKNKLETLDLRGLSFITDKYSALYELKALTSLRLQFKTHDSGFIIEDGGLNEAGLRKLAETYRDQLEELSLSGNTQEWQSDTYIDAFANFTKLKKLSIVDCPLVNDHSIQLLSSSPLQNTLKHLELKALSLSDTSIEYIAQFKKLTQLLIANCYGLTEKGRLSLIQNPQFQNQLVALGLGSFSLSKEMAFDIIKNYKVLTDLSMYNSEPWPDVRDEMLDMAKQKVPANETIHCKL